MTTLSPELAVVIPIDLLRRAQDLVERLRRIVTSHGMERFEIVIAHNDRGTAHDRAFVRHFPHLPNVKLISARFYSGQINSGYLRNRAVEMATAPILMLLDVDIAPDPLLFEECAGLVARGNRLVMLPCLYLTAWASRRLTRKLASAEEIVGAYLRFQRRYFQHLASPSSVVFLERKNFWEIGGFDETFQGHGYEDFDFIVRFAIHHGLIPASEDLLENRTYRAPLLAEGFRKYLGQISLPFILKRKIVFHLYHDRKNRDAYYKARDENGAIFLNKVRALLRSCGFASPRSTSLIDYFFALCKETGVDAHDYFVLFDTRPGHVDRLSSWRERLKYVFGWE